MRILSFLVQKRLLETLRFGDVGRIGGELVVTRGESWGGGEDDCVGEWHLCWW